MLRVFKISIVPILCIFVSFEAQSQPQDLDMLQKEIQNNPTNVELRIKYAQMARESGDLDAALKELSKAVLLEPENVELWEEYQKIVSLQKRSKTSAVATVGGTYLNNSPRRDPTYLTLDDAQASISAAVLDERWLGETQFRSQIQGYANYHNRWSRGDFEQYSVSTGPVYNNVGGWDINPSVAFKIARSHSKPLFKSGGLDVNFSSRSNELLRSLFIGASWEEYKKAYVGRDGARVNAGARLSLGHVFTDADQFSISPQYKFVAASASKNRYHKIETGLTYFDPYSDDVHFIVSASPYISKYMGSEADEASDRLDWGTNAGLTARLPNFMDMNFALEGRYTFEINRSNDYDKTYRAHGAGVYMTFRY